MPKIGPKINKIEIWLKSGPKVINSPNQSHRDHIWECLNYKSGLRILIWPLEVPFLLVTFGQKCPFSDQKKWHFEWPNQNSKTWTAIAILAMFTSVTDNWYLIILWKWTSGTLNGLHLTDSALRRTTASHSSASTIVPWAPKGCQGNQTSWTLKGSSLSDFMS